MGYQAILRSELKQNIILSLLESSKKLSELKSNVATSETTILHALKEFENLGLTTKNSGVYSLTSIGYIEASICKKLAGTAEVIEKFKDFWAMHDIKAIPADFILRLNSLEDASLVRTESSELGKVHETFMQLLLNSKKLKGTSPIFHPDYVVAFRRLLEEGGSVDLICTQQVLGKTLQTAASGGQAELFQKFIKEDQLKIYLVSNLKIALTVTDSIFSMGLFTLDGVYDYNMDLVSLNPEAVKWGEAVFENYVKQSKRLNLQDFTLGVG